MAIVTVVSLTGMAFAKNVRWESLNLTNQQSSEIDRLESDWRRTYMQLSPQIQRDTDELMQLMQSPNADSGRILQLQNRINDNKEQLQSTAMRIHLKKREALNPEQRMQLQRMMSDQ